MWEFVKKFFNKEEKRSANGMTPKELKQCMDDADAVRQTAVNNARQVLTSAFANAAANAYGFVIEVRGEGVHRYIYDSNDGGELKALEDIEEKGYEILDEDEEHHWIEVIKPEEMINNILREDMAHNMAFSSAESMSEVIAEEIDREIVDKIVTDAITYADEQKDKLKKLKNRYYKFKSYLKTPPMAVYEENIPSFEEWLKHEGETVDTLFISNDEPSDENVQ